MNRLQSKYTEYILAPSNALTNGVNCEYVTTDGVSVLAELHTTWNNSDGYFDDELERECMDRFNCPFRFIKSVWFGRLGVLSDYWHLIKLIKI